MRLRPQHAADYYKTGHVFQYEPGCTEVYSNYTPRSRKYATVLPDFDNKVVNYGLQGVLKWLLTDLWNAEFFKQPKEQVIGAYKRRMDLGLGEGAVPVAHMAALHDLGYLPILIKALPEGARVNLRVPLWTIRNTVPQFYWLTNYLETQLSSECWKTVNNATVAYEFYRLLRMYALRTGCPVEFVKWQGHDFSMRGMSGIYDASQSGSAHLLSFYGTDTITALDYLEDYYGGSSTFLGGSVPATEHSVMCMGKRGGELATITRIIRDLYPKGVVSVVSDTWDFWDVVTKFATALKPIIEARQPDPLGLMKVVFRPDSGDPFLILCGDPSSIPGSPAYKGAIQCLWEVFGGTVNQQGFRVLNPIVGLIYGDSITLPLAELILSRCEAMGFCTSCLVFGIGSYTYQCATRDNFGQAIKSTFGVVNGEDRELFKDPVTDSGMKKSAQGLLRVEKEGGDYVLYDHQTRAQEQTGALEPVFLNGLLLRDDNVANIRTRLGV